MAAPNPSTALRAIITDLLLDKALSHSSRILGEDVVEAEIYFDLARKTELGHKLPNTPRSRHILDLAQLAVANHPNRYVLFGVCGPDFNAFIEGGKF